MKHQPFYLPRSGKLVTQLPGGITFAYDLRLGRLRDHWKCLAKEYNVETEKQWIDISFLAQTMPKKCRLGPQNGPGSLGPEKLLKNANLK